MAGMLLEGSRMSYEKITSEGFQYNFTDLESTLKDLLK
jgi:NAD dependent epimerase/dehydratase family enzyme